MIFGQTEGEFARSKSTLIDNSVFANNIFDKYRLSMSVYGDCMSEISYHEPCYVGGYQI